MYNYSIYAGFERALDAGALFEYGLVIVIASGESRAGRPAVLAYHSYMPS